MATIETALNARIVNVAQGINRIYQQINQTMNQNNIILRQTNITINQAAQSQENLNNALKKGENFAERLKNNLKGLAKVNWSDLSKKVLAGLQSTDSFITMQARLGLIVDEGQTPDQLRDNVFAAAQRSRRDFAATAGNVSKLGLLAGDSFSDTNEIVAFTELMQKAFQISGAPIAKQQAGIEQIIQAMAAGKLQGDVFWSMMENAPMLVDAISRFTGKSKDELTDMFAEGAISADIFKGALFAAADDINEKFQQTPKTFESIFTTAKNQALMAFQPLMQEIARFMQTDSFQQLIHGITLGFQLLGAVAAGVFHFMLENLSLVKSLLITLGIVALAVGIQWLISWLALWWPILAVIGVITALLYILDMLGVSISDVVGYITGAFYSLFAFLWNQVAFLYNLFLSFAEFLVNLFIDPVYAIKKLFYDLAKNVVDFFAGIMNGITSKIDWLINKINKVTGSKISLIGTLDTSWVEALKPTTDKGVVDLSKYKMPMKDLGDAFNDGFTKGSGFVSKLSGMLDGINNFGGSDQVGERGGAGGLGTTDGLGASPNINRVNEVGKINDTVDISSEDLKTMRELAEMKSIQSFVTLTPQFTFGDTHIRQDGRTIEEIIANISEQLTEAIASGAQGVYG